MNTRTSISRIKHASRLAALLLSTTSFAVVAAAHLAQAQTANTPPAQGSDTEVAEQVLVTGSLIHGAAAVGVPVTSLDMEDFEQAGALDVSDALKVVPQIEVVTSGAHTAAGASLTHSERIQIHDLGFFRTLVLYDGMRYPLTGVYSDGYDPEIVPTLAIDHVDTLSDGASATYGSDAIAGVVNVILRRAYDGAITQFQYNLGTYGGNAAQFSQLFGRTWDGGDVTVSFDVMEQSPIWSANRSTLETYNFTPYGLDNRIPLSAAIPAIASTGSAVLPTAAANPYGTQGAGCTNCFNTPAGTTGGSMTTTSGVTTYTPLSWSQFTTMTMTSNNLVSPYQYSQLQGPMDRTRAAITFDQEITSYASLFGDAFYMNRDAPLIEPNLINPWNGGVTSNAIIANDPYYPTGAPAGLRVSFSLAAVADPDVEGKADSGRYDFGVNLKLPFDWTGKLFFASSQEDDSDHVNSINQNNVQAALGNIVGDPTGQIAPYVISSSTTPIYLTAAQVATSSFANYAVGTQVHVISPSVVPFLNPFCDSTAYPGVGTACMPTALYNFLNGYWIDQSHVTLQQVGASFDGPLFALPAGPVRAAVGGAFEADNYAGAHYINSNTVSTEYPTATFSNISRQVGSAFAQLNIPLAGQNFNFPLVQKLDLEVSGRFDDYSDFGTTINPKFAANWVPFDGLKIAATYGTSFRAPTFNELSPLTGKNVSGTNIGSSQEPACPGGIVGGTPVAGSAGAILDPTCSAALMYPQIASMNGGAITSYGLTRPSGDVLKPETADNFSTGFEYTPTNFLSGLDLQATYYEIVIHNYLGTPTIPGGDPLTAPGVLKYLVLKGMPAGSDQVNFNTVLAAYTTSPFAASNVAASGSTIAVLEDGMTNNLFRQYEDGVDFSGAYNWDMGFLGRWNVGLNYTYLLDLISQDQASDPATNLFRDASTTNTDYPHAHARAQLGWTSADDSPSAGFSATLFVNYVSHYFSTETPPSAQLLTALCGACSTNPNAFEHIPAQFTFDFTVGYDLGERPANDYLKGLNFRLVVTNVMNRQPPFVYKISTSGGDDTYDGANTSPTGRTIGFILTKDW